MNESEFRALIEQSCRRPLNDAEQVQLSIWLAAHPEHRTTWEDEAALNRYLDNLPDAPVSSNFTALVMQAVERESALNPQSPPAPVQTLRIFWRRLTWAA